MSEDLAEPSNHAEFLHLAEVPRDPPKWVTKAGLVEQWNREAQSVRNQFARIYGWLVARGSADAEDFRKEFLRDEVRFDESISGAPESHQQSGAEPEADG